MSVPRPLKASLPVVIRYEDLILREFREKDIPRMVEMFDTEEMERWTPLAHPFDAEAAADYIAASRLGPQRGWLQLAITIDEEHALGEVQIFPTDDPAMVDYAYGVGADYRGMRLGSRAVMATLPLVRSEGYSMARIRVPQGNVGSGKVARDAGFTLTDAPLISFEARGYVYDQVTWLKELGTV
jgi:RimJ/RimL family protein N-acetyltransferase